MIAVDTNILVYAHRADSRFHESAAHAVRKLAEGKAAWAIPWACVHEFITITTHPRIYDPPSSVDSAIAQVTGWVDSPNLVLLSEGLEHFNVLTQFVVDGDAIGPRVHDARIAAICAAAGVSELWSADRDFSRYPIKVRNPLL